MKISVNGQPVDARADQDRTVAGLLNVLRRRGDVPAGEVVARVDVDGRTGRTQDWEALLATSLEQVDELSVETADAKRYATLILNDAKSMLTVLTDGARAAAQSLRTDPVEKANRNLFLLFDAIQNFLACLYQVQNVCDLPERVVSSDAEVLQRMDSTLEKVENAQKRGDWQEIVHNLEGELIPLLSEFFDIMERIGAEVNRVGKG